MHQCDSTWPVSCIPLRMNPLAPGPLKHPPVASLDELASHILDMQMPVSLFPNAYDNLVLIQHRHDSYDTEAGTFDIFSASYDTNGSRYTAHE